MPAVEELIYAALSQGSPLTDAGDRVYPLEAPQGTPPPYIVFARVAADPQNSLSGHAGLDNVRMQIDGYATSKAGASRLARQIRARMDGQPFKAICVSDIDAPPDPDTRHYRHSIDFKCWDRF